MKLVLPLWFGFCCYLLDYCVTVDAVNPTENEVDDYAHKNHQEHPKSPASELIHEVDIIKLMNVSVKDQGVSLVEGPIKKFPAYKFRLPYGNVPLSNSTQVTSAMSNPNGFTVVFVIRQQRNNLGTLISLNSPGRLTPWFQLSSNSKTGSLTLKYRLKGSSKPRQIEWNLPKYHRKSPLAAWTWISVSIDFRTDIIRLDLDCQPSRFDTLSSAKDQETISIPKDSLVYFRQEPGRKKKFLGSMQVAKILPYVLESRLWSCLQISQNSAPGFNKPIV